MSDSNGVVVLWCCSLLACIVLSFAQYCPPQELISPCTCEYLRTTCSRIEQLSVLKRVFRNTLDRPLPALLLKDVALMYFPAEALNQKKIQTLMISRSIVSTVFDRVVEENWKLKELRLIDTKVLKGIEWRLFKNIQYLQHLEIEGTHIGKLGKEFRDNVPTSLRRLKLKNSKRAWLADRVFDKLTVATHIHVPGGKISTLKRSMFPKKDNWILSLNFNNNRISYLPDDIFSDMPYLMAVWMSGNKFTTISESVFGKIFVWVDIDLNDNKIECDCRISWITLSAKSKINGTCDSPGNYKGKEFKNIHKEDFEYCFFN